MSLAKPDVVTLLRGKVAQRSNMAALCVEAADEILRLRSRYAALRRANSIALRELVAGRQKDEAVGGKPIVTEWVPSREMIIDASS